jgi:CRISPR-associated protein Csh2
MNEILESRQEFFFAYDIRMGNPNGDPDENRPRVLPDGTYYVTDVRLKRFIRDFFKSQNKPILVDNIEGRTTNLTGRVSAELEKQGKKEANGQELVNIILDTFIDARLFGSSLAFKEEKRKEEEEQEKKKNEKSRDWKPIPKTLTGALQINHGEVLHEAQEVEIRGTTTFGSDPSKTQGTFTEFFGLRYALIGFNGVANEHSANISRLSKDDYDQALKAMWLGIRSVANTRSKAGQVPRFLISISYKEGHEFQFGNLLEYVKTNPNSEKESKDWSNPKDYTLDISLLRERLEQFSHHIDQISYCISPDIKLSAEDDKNFLYDQNNLNFDGIDGQ